MQNPIAVEYHERGEVRPTLVVGLGGSGVYTARRLKRLIQERYSTEGLIRFLYVDTDQGQFQHEPTLADVEPEEMVPLAIAHPEQIVDEWRRNKDLHPYLDFLNGDVNVGLLRNADGAAGIRPIGRFGFHASFDHIYPRFQHAVQRIMQVEEQVRALMATVPYSVEVVSSQPRIYLITSLCGGTGSGIYFDTALVLREILLKQNLDGEIIGIFYLPSVFQNEAGISRSMREVIEANAYAALMELEYFCNANHLSSQQWEVKYRMIPPIVIKEPLVDEAYVVESANAAGRSLGSKYEVFEMIARSLLMDIGSPLGARARSAKRNSLAIIDAIRCPETGEHRLLSSLAVASIAVPIQELTEYCCLRVAHARLRQKFSGTAQHDFHEEAQNFLRTNGLTAEDIRKDFNPILAASGKVNLDPDDPKRGLDRAKQRAIEQEQKLEAYEKQVRKEVLNKAKTALETRCQQLEQEHGIEGARLFLEALLRCIDQESKSALQNSEPVPPLSWDEVLQKIEGSSRGLRIPITLGGAKQRRVREQEVRVQNYLERKGASEVLQKVADILGADTDSMAALVRQERSRRADEYSATEQIIRAIEERLREIENPEYGKSGTAYPLEQLACLRRHFKQFYDTHGAQFEKPVDIYVSGNTIVVRSSGRREGKVYWVSNMAELLNRLVQLVAEAIARQIREAANVMEFLKPVYEEEQTSNTDDKTYLERKVEYLLQVARPFWSAAQPPGNARFEEFIAVSVPLSPEDYNRAEEARRLDEAVEKITRLAGVACERVRDGYPFALTVLNRTYGARAYYLKSVPKLEHSYRTRIRNRQVQAHLHLDARFAQLPKLTPPDPEAYLWWTVALNLGYVAQIDGRFYFGVDATGPHAVPRPRYQTQREIRLPLTDEAGNSLLEGIYRGGDPEALLGEDYTVAQRIFMDTPEYQEQTRSAFESIKRAVGRESLIKSLEELEKRLREAANRADEESVHWLRNERDRISSLIASLKEESNVLSHNGRRGW
ncbi:MAG: tubulin-like doman-containing protein [Armatimonadetes bacterium]|nr:tubulin-like doman-containing protein [Armatimonadota bacterium]CUU35792.1 Tubulin like [Armatimonadetes bacterium DC]